MATVLLTETGDKLISEPQPGIAGASTLNDTSTNPIIKETFETNPVTRGWNLGSGWAWDSTNQRLQFT